MLRVVFRSNHVGALCCICRDACQDDSTRCKICSHCLGCPESRDSMGIGPGSEASACRDSQANPDVGHVTLWTPRFQSQSFRENRSNLLICFNSPCVDSVIMHRVSGTFFDICVYIASFVAFTESNVSDKGVSLLSDQE